MNPFSINYNPEYFCDREKEISILKRNIENGLNTLIHSPRRLGKTALLLHLNNSLSKEKIWDTIYVDLFSTSDMNGMITLLAEAILKKYHKKNLIAGASRILKGISPVISFAPDGSPSLSLNLMENQQKQTLEELLGFLEKQKKPVLVCLDEFQELATYPEKAEALLRTYVQQLNNVRFVYSGSSSHLLKDIFLNAKRPFYQSSEVIVLDKINKEKYGEFISNSFKKNERDIDNEAIEYILDFSEAYTYFTQVCCNLCFSKTNKKLSLNEARIFLDEYIESRKPDYLQLLNLLPENQKKVLIGVAKEGQVKKPTAFDFILKYKLPSGSSTLQAIKSLSDKEILYYQNGIYTVYDIFFRKFLIRYY